MRTNESIRLRTEPGSNTNINVKIEQEFDTIDFLSLKITQQDAYRNFCSDYGVVAGRVIANDGFGIANAKISVFIPLSSEDEEDPIISSLYPYFTPTDVDDAGVRYNLLPELGKNFTTKIKVPNSPLGNYNNPEDFYASFDDFTPLGSYVQGSTWEQIFEESIFGAGGYSVWKRNVVANSGPETPVGTFPSKTKMLNNNVLLEIYDKYYTYTTTTNGSGDYMLFGVPTGVKTLHMDVDLSDIGGDSLIPDDFISTGFPPSQFNSIGGNLRFKSSSNLDELPQIESQNISVEVIPFWGNLEQCEIGITRQDFNLTKQINPSALLVFEAFANKESSRYIKKSTNSGPGCGSAGGDDDKIGAMLLMGNLGVGVEACESIDGVGVGDFLPTRTFPDGKVIYTIPMWDERKVTNEFGDIVDGDDANEIGIPTAGKYNIFVYSLTNNHFVGDTDSVGFGTHLVREVKYLYDIENQKRLVYTVGTASQLHDGVPERKTNAIVVNGTNYFAGGSNLNFPSTNKFGSDVVFSAIDGAENLNNYPIVHGSLYFRRFEVDVDNGQDLRYCTKTVRDYSNSGFYGVPPTASNWLYQGDISNTSGPRNPTYGALHITNLLKLFKPFGGSLSETSADNFIFNNQTVNPGSNGVDISNQTYPITSSVGVNNQGEVDNIPVGLDTIVEPSSPQYTSFNTKIVRTNTGSGDGKLGDLMVGQSMGEKSKEGRYFFYFGLKANNTVLTKLKSFLGV
ncbi:hypothetical protein N9966_00120 [bacterium]|nr:hypothetical protein [bacterium]